MLLYKNTSHPRIEGRGVFLSHLAHWSLSHKHHYERLRVIKHYVMMTLKTNLCLALAGWKFQYNLLQNLIPTSKTQILLNTSYIDVSSVKAWNLIFLGKLIFFLALLHQTAFAIFIKTSVASLHHAPVDFLQLIHGFFSLHIHLICCGANHRACLILHLSRVLQTLN